MPVYTCAGELETLALSTGQGRSRGLLRPAGVADIPAMVEAFNQSARRYQYSAVLSAPWLRGLDGSRGLALGDFLLATEGGRVTSMVALWDQRRIKQTVARGYRFPLGLVRVGYNVLSAASGGVALPPAGKPLEQIYLAFAAFASIDAAPAVIGEALARARERGAAAGVIGLAGASPLVAVIKGRFRTYSYRSCIETVSWGTEPAAAAAALPAQPEVAIL
jgi:hypothetical protein